MIRTVIKNERFCIFFTVLMLVLAGASWYADSSVKNDFYWFQRSGALIVLAGANLQYSKLVNLWEKAFQREMALEPVSSKIASGQGISMLSMANESVQTRDFAIRIHDIVTEKSMKDVWAVIFIIAGTVIWGYGDIPFRDIFPTQHSPGG